MKHTLLYVILLFFAIGCEKDEPEYSIFTLPFDGNYKVVSMTSNILVDLDFDGIYSYDFLNEFYYVPRWFGYPSEYDVRLTTPTGQKNTYLFTRIPYMKRYPPEYNIDNTTILLGGPPSLNLLYDKNYKIFNILNSQEEVGVAGVRINSVSIINQDTIKIMYEHHNIYDENEQIWKTITIEGIFERK